MSEQQLHDEQLPVVLREHLPNTHPKIQEQCYKQLSKVLANWQATEVRTVPNVMYQVRCGHDEFDQSIEYQINWFVHCAETFIHNHRHSFDSYCLEGEYTENIWEIVDDGDGKMTYQFHRNPDTTLELCQTLPGTLCHIKSRCHFPGNQIHVDTCQFHSIASVVGSSSRILTFLVKRNYSPAPEMFVLSISPTLTLVDNEIRPATDEERQAMYEKLEQVLTRSFCQ